MTENEKFVRETWADCEYREPFVWLGPVGTTDHDSPFIGWEPAATYTRQHKEKVGQVEEEIEWLEDHAEIPEAQQELYLKAGLVFSADFLHQKAVAQRILAREQAALSDLRKGMKN